MNPNVLKTDRNISAQINWYKRTCVFQVTVMYVLMCITFAIFIEVLLRKMQLRSFTVNANHFFYMMIIIVRWLISKNEFTFSGPICAQSASVRQCMSDARIHSSAAGHCQKDTTSWLFSATRLATFCPKSRKARFSTFLPRESGNSWPLSSRIISKKGCIVVLTYANIIGIYFFDNLNLG